MTTADRPNLRIDADRLWSSLMELGQIGGSGSGACFLVFLVVVPGGGFGFFIHLAADGFGLGSGLYTPRQAVAETAAKARAYVEGVRG